MRHAMAGAFVALAMAATAGCSADVQISTTEGGSVSEADDDGRVGVDDDVFFAVDRADALAHAAILDATELPGAGWEQTAIDDFDDGEDDLAFEEAMAGEPACATMEALSGFGGFFGSSDEDEELPAGRAQVEFENATIDPMLPAAIELEVEIEETVAEIQGGWGLAKELIGGDDFGACMLAILPKAFADADMPEGVELNVALRDNSSAAPNDGVAMGFDMDMSLGALELQMAMEMYMWPRGNAGVTAMFLGTPDTLDAGLVGNTLAALDDKLTEAAAS